MLGVPGTQQREAQYQDGRRCTKTPRVEICACLGKTEASIFICGVTA